MGRQEEFKRTKRNLGFWVFALCLPIAVLVPVIFDPTVVYLDPAGAFYPVKFSVLIKFSVPLLIAVLSFALLERRGLNILLLVPVCTFFGISALSAVLSEDVTHTLVGDRYDGLLTLGAGILLFYAAGRCLDSWARVRVLFVAGVTTAVIVSVYGILQHFDLDPVPGWDIPWYPGTERAFSTIGNPLQLAAYLTLAMGMSAALYFRTDARWEKVLWLSALAVVGVGWFYAYARGAMLGVSLALPLMLWLSYRRMKTVRPLLLPVGILAIAIVAASQLGSPGASERVTSTGGDSALSVLTRLYIWRDALPVISERPLLGHGPDNFAEPFGRYEGEDLKRTLYDEDLKSIRVVDKAHNEFLQVAATTGLFGLAAYLWILLSYFRHAYRSGGWTIIALSGGVLAYILQLQTVFSTIATGVTFWTVLGASVAVIRLQQQEGTKEQNPSLSEETLATPGQPTATQDYLCALWIRVKLFEKRVDNKVVEQCR